MADISTLRNLTDEVIQRSEQIKNSHYDLRNLFLMMSDMILITDLNGHITDINNAVYEILRYSVEDMKSRSFFEIINHPESIINDIQKNENICNGHVVKYIEFIHRDNHIVYTECKIHKTMWNEQESFIIISRDVSDRIRYEQIMNEKHNEIEAAYQELKAIEEELKKQLLDHQYSENLIRSLCDNVPDMIWAKDMNKKYVFANKTVCNKLLCVDTYKDVLEKTDVDLAQIQRNLYPNDPDWHTFGELCQDSDKIVMNTMKPSRFYEYGNVRGIPLHLEVYKSPFIYNDEIIGTVGCARDITEEIALKKEISNRTNFINAVLKALPIPVFYKSVDNVYLDCNEAFCTFYGASRSYIIGKCTYDLFPDIADKMVNRDKDLIEFPSKILYSNFEIYDAHWKKHTVTIIKTSHIDHDENILGIIGIVTKFDIQLSGEYTWDS